MQVFVHAGGVGEKDCKRRLKKQPEIEGPEKKTVFQLQNALFREVHSRFF